MPGYQMSNEPLGSPSESREKADTSPPLREFTKPGNSGYGETHYLFGDSQSAGDTRSYLLGNGGEEKQNHGFLGVPTDVWDRAGKALVSAAILYISVYIAKGAVLNPSTMARVALAIKIATVRLLYDVGELAAELADSEGAAQMDLMRGSLTSPAGLYAYTAGTVSGLNQNSAFEAGDFASALDSSVRFFNGSGPRNPASTLNIYGSLGAIGIASGRRNSRKFDHP